MVREMFMSHFRYPDRRLDPEFNVLELRPPNMDETGKTKYPVLFHL